MTTTTSIDREELAYNVPLWRSPRKGRVRLPSGRIGRVRLGVPDTAWTIPAVACLDGRRLAGFVMWDDNAGEYRFTVDRRYNHPSNPCPGAACRGCGFCKRGA